MLKLNLGYVFFVSSVVLGQTLFIGTLNFPSQTNVAYAQSYNNSGLVRPDGSGWFKVKNYDLSYNPESGRCVTRDYNGKIVQDISGCRKTWTAIVRVGMKSILFYDKNAGDIEVYEISNGIGKLQQRLSGTARKTWKDVKSSSIRTGASTEPGYIFYFAHFEDDKGTKEKYNYMESKGLYIVKPGEY